MNSYERQQVWVLAIWRLRHGDFISVRADEDSMAIPVGEVQRHETPERAANRICREQVGLEVVEWDPSKRPSEIDVMVAVVTEATIDLAAGAVWLDVEQLPMMSAIAWNLDLLEAWFHLQHLTVPQT